MIELLKAELEWLGVDISMDPNLPPIEQLAFLIGVVVAQASA